ncbi:response regulator [Lysinibacillus mangiferihumi]|uniref:Response regulator n=2 Tax=Lysinibacillus mangiferihumi TaxID=1130819 RepID=A0A4U2XZ50_9BACI|nr:response regulator [Lysinibacillus mangiferihumi]TKI53269.1 response regulator [Lysinibacillus mangiferihumi]
MDIAQTLKNQLDKYGYQSVITQDFDKVLDHFQAFQPHLVLMDINLPNLPAFDGYYWSYVLYRIYA